MIFKNGHLITSILLFLFTWLFAGLFYDSEFHEPELFIKNGPTFKVNYYSPIGMSDLSINDLTPEKRIEENAYEHFVVKRNRKLSFLPFILIQLTLTSLVFGFYKLKYDVVYKIWPLPSHFLLNFIPTSILMVLILAFDKTYLSVLFTTIIISVNYFTLFSLVPRQRN